MSADARCQERWCFCRHLARLKVATGAVKRAQRRHGGVLHRGQDVLSSVLIRTSLGNRKSHNAHFQRVLSHGPSNIGKTQIIAIFLRGDPPSYDKFKGVELRPVVSMQMPPAPDQKCFYRALLEVSGVPQSPTSTVCTLEHIPCDWLCSAHQGRTTMRWYGFRNAVYSYSSVQLEDAIKAKAQARLHLRTRRLT